MAVLKKPVFNKNPFAEQIGDDLAPKGTFTATIIDIKDEFGVKRQKYQSQETEEVDLTTFLFGFRTKDGKRHKVASKTMKISGSEQSNLFGFLKNLLGHSPEYGWDYLILRGDKCFVTVEHLERKNGDGVYANIASLSPIPEGYDGGEPAQQPSDPKPPQPSPQPQLPATAVSVPNAPQGPSVDSQENEVPF